MRKQIGVHLRVVDHFAEQEDPFPGIFFHGSESDLNGILHPVTKTEMPCQEDLQGAKVKQGGCEIPARWRGRIFHLIQFLSFFLYGTDQGAAVDDGDVEAFHDAKLSSLQSSVGSLLSAVLSRQSAVNKQL